MMSREERDKIGRNDWPNLSDAVLREIRDFKATCITEIMAKEESTGDYQDFGMCMAINSLQQDVAALNKILEMRTYEV